MYDKTATHTSIDVSALESERPKVVGLVAVHTEADAVLGSTAIEAPARLGRDASMDLVVLDPKVSRQHALLEPASGGIFLTDLGSHNGTFLDGQRLGHDRLYVPVGSTLRMGKTLFRVVGDHAAFHDYPNGTEPPLIGGPGLSDVRARIGAFGRSPNPILVQGETGTGKERVAEAIHLASGRPGKFVPVNCAAIPSELVESELFGHSKGAFSGSQRARPGLFRTAEAGTLLLDELGELPLTLQAKLLRVVEDGMVRPVGEDSPQLVDVRIVAATNRNLEEMVDRGAFRADLMHRLAAMRLFIPPLRDRMEDVPILVKFFLKDDPIAVSAAAMGRFLVWHWPGNVRELRNHALAASAAARARNAEMVDVEDLLPMAAPPGSYTGYGSTAYGGQPGAHPGAVVPAHGAVPPGAVPPGSGAAPVPGQAFPSAADTTAREVRPGDDLLRARIMTALELRKGNVAQVARDLNMRRPGLYEAFTRLGIDPAQFRRR